MKAGLDRAGDRQACDGLVVKGKRLALSGLERSDHADEFPVLVKERSAHQVTKQLGTQHR
ncbi:MAG TPA: hypothetical protein DD979_12610 [Gammaproteobacteria bacterium]|jgi:hypothetical protein|nr:hypothetical protein [Gammaproteobacteria bacterium]